MKKCNIRFIEVWFNTLIVFFYIFSFYIVGPLTSSIFIAVPFIVCCLISSIYRNWLFDELKNPFILQILLFQLLLIGLGLWYSTVHLTFDFSYIKTIFGQMIHFICGIFIILYLKNKNRIDSSDIEKYIIYAFLIQSLIQLIAITSPTIAAFILYFNRAEALQAAYGGGVRGLALSSGVGWSLALTYGLVYIIYTKRYLLNRIRIKEILGGIILLSGTFFAGRTGFVGACLGSLFFLLNNQKKILYKFFFVLEIFFSLILFCCLFYLLFPGLTNHLVEKVFPFALEPFYKLYYNDRFSTGSTDVLSEMWQVPVSLSEFLFGTGYFMDPVSGAYYKAVDVGVLRNLFYWGILGYTILVIYQLVMIRPIRYVEKVSTTSHRNMILYKNFIILYLVLLEFKAMTIGFNKMTFSVIFLLSFFYLEDCKAKKLV